MPAHPQYYGFTGVSEANKIKHVVTMPQVPLNARGTLNVTALVKKHPTIFRDSVRSPAP